MSSVRLGTGWVWIGLIGALAAAGCAKDASGGEQSCVPGLEVCNGIDDDCDKLIDEDEAGMKMTRDCSNGCGAGIQVCEHAEWSACDAPPQQQEVCNGKDDDCDGFADNGFDCAIGDTRPCGSDVGECREGTQECQNGCTWGDCIGDVEPQDETCDGSKDDDCDGTVDNGCGCSAGETKTCCGGTTIECGSNGKWPSCPAPPTEICDGVDQDCSGAADDHLPADPYMADEAANRVDSCEQAYTAAFVTPLIENGATKKYDFFLYKNDGSPDRDFFSFPTGEESNAECVSNPSYYECYLISVRITKEPPGTDYELCLYDMGGSSAGASCTGKPKTCSGADGNPPNEVTYGYEGGCGIDDDNRFVVEVFAASGSDNSCQPYGIEMELVGSGPQPDACGF